MTSCLNGHSICEDCSDNVDTCPVCRIALVHCVTNRLVNEIRELVDYVVSRHFLNLWLFSFKKIAAFTLFTRFSRALKRIKSFFYNFRS